MDLSGRLAIVTGSGRGIGKTIAIRLAHAGADVVINNSSNKNDELETVAEEIGSIGRECLPIVGNVSSASFVDSLVAQTMEKFGRIDILVNNAGILRDKLLLRMTEEEWDEVMAVNLKGVFLCTKAVLRPMSRARWGRIINISSIVGLVGNPGQANYSASKAGIIGFTKTVAKEAAPRAITVNAIAPGFIETDMTRQLNEEQRNALLSHIPLGTFGTPDDVAEAVTFLSSEGARYITGHVLNVDGGMGGS